MPPRISLKRVAKITNRPVVDILARIHEIAGQPLSEEDRKEIAAQAGLTAPDDEAPIREPPEWTSQEPKEVVDLLASDERLDSDPMVPIQQALRRCGPGEFILIKHKWEPQPLYDIRHKAGNPTLRRSADERPVVDLRAQAGIRRAGVGDRAFQESV